MINNLRTYGTGPFTVAVVHGGPGAHGDMAAVAQELSGPHGVLEPLQTASTPDGQVRELTGILSANRDLPLTLIGHSWGALLSFMVTAKDPAPVKKNLMILQ